jgi:superfamily II DNA/RNA helicase
MGLSDMGFSKPTPIQSQAIPVVLEGKDLLASAQTGTGKTAAFALPLLQKLSSNKKNGIRALILAPTRELAVQIDEQFWTIGYHTGVTTATVYGGTDWGAQEQAIRDGVNVLVATPGRLLDHIKVSNVDFSQIEFLVLDEADRMLDMGFIPDVMTIIRRLPKERQTLMFSATLSDKIESLARELTKNPVRINISSFKPAEGVDQRAYKVGDDQKLELVLHLFDDVEVASAIIFTGTKRGADSLARALRKKGVKVSSIHGDRDQKEREATLGDFKAGRINVIVATDVMARGIDVTGVSHVVNFDVPRDLDDYIHRIGRTARAEKTGTAITLVNRQDFRYFQVISEKMGSRLKIYDNPVGSPSEPQQEPTRNNSNRKPPAAPKEKPQGAAKEKVQVPATEKSEATITATTSEDVDAQKSRSKPKRRNNRRKPKPEGSDSQQVTKTEAPSVPKEARSNDQRERSDASRNANRGRGNRSSDRNSNESRDQRERPNPRGNRPNQGGKTNDPQQSREKQRQELIQQVSNPFQQNKVEKPEPKSEEKGLFGKILSIFGTKK